MRTPRQTAILIAVMLNRSGLRRARVSSITLKILGERSNLRSAFVLEVIEELADFDWALLELKTGFGALRISALEASKVISYKGRFSEQERREFRLNPDWDALEAEAMSDLFSEELDEEIA